MNITTTGIAVAVALAVIAVFFIFPGLSPFSTPAAQTSADLSVGGQPSAASSTNANTMTTPDGLQITDTVVGTGATAEAGDQVTVNYVGTLADGTVFDASANHPQTANGFTFSLGAGQVIKGWDEGVAGMKVGGTRILVIPAALAYGANGVPGVIPANATLTFQVQLLNVASAQ